MTADHILTITLAAAYVMLRIATDDTTLMVPRKDDPSKVDSIPLKKGTEVVLDCVGSSECSHLVFLLLWSP